MKKLFPVIAIATIAFATSCSKTEQQDQTVTQTVNATMRMNESYAFTLPANTTDDPYRVVGQPAHASVSHLGKDASGNDVYEYTPAKDYVGADQVVIQTSEEQHNPPPPGAHPPMGNGGCQHHDRSRHHAEIQQQIIVNFVINRDGSSASRAASVSSVQ